LYLFRVREFLSVTTVNVMLPSATLYSNPEVTMSYESEFEKFEQFEKFEEEGGLVHELDHSGNRTGRNVSKAQHAQHTGTVPTQAVVTGVATTNPVPGQPAPAVAPNPPVAPSPVPPGTDPRAYGQG
jgi:hypothetical protein